MRPARRSRKIWAQADELTDPAQIFERLLASLATFDPRAREVVGLCSRPRAQIVLPEFVFLSEDATPAVERNNLRLLFGRWLVQEKMIDEALVQLEPLKPDQVADPASLLFYQAVVLHSTLQKKPGLEAIAKLLEREKRDPAPVCFGGQIDGGRLFAAQGRFARPHCPAHGRRAAAGSTWAGPGPKVREVEDGVIKSLDKLIEEMEAAAAAAAAMAAAGAQGTIRSSSPAPDSMPLQGKGPGNVTKKDIGHESGWGDLPAKQRQEALQQIGKDFPAHYRDVIEQYFRKLASEDSDKR